MAAGDRKIKLQELKIPRPAGGNVIAEIRWLLYVEDKVASDKEVIGGNLSLDLGTWAVAQTKTLLTIMNDAITAINTDGSMPGHDSAS
jgi:hypothetical protein